MTREEQIEKAVSEVLEERQTAVGRKKYGGWCFVNWFKEGVKWADEHPKSPWISVEEDLPCNHEGLVLDSWHTEQVFVRIVAKNGVILYTTNAMINVQLDKKWKWTCGEEYKVTHWMPIPKYE